MRLGTGGGRIPKPASNRNVEGYVPPHKMKGRLDTKLVVEGDLKPPRKLTAGQRELWSRVVEGMPHGSLGERDRSMLTELVKTWKMLQAAGVAADANPLDRDTRCTYIAYLSEFSKLAQHFGLTPASRSRIRVSDYEKEESPQINLISKFG